MEVNQELIDKLKYVLGKLAEALRPMVKALVNYWNQFKEIIVEHHQFREDKQTSIRNHHKVNFTRQKMHHQVIECKPRHLIKKIIR
jgi:hypothetical protein